MAKKKVYHIIHIKQSFQDNAEMNRNYAEMNNETIRENNQNAEELNQAYSMTSGLRIKGQLFRAS